MPAYRGRTNAGTDYPVARALARSVINLPLHVNAAGVRKVVSVLEELLGNAGERPD